MATNTYVALDTKTVGTAVSSITFTSIPQGYTDLVLVASILGSAGGYYPRIRINGDTGSSYSYTWISGNGSTADSNRASNVSGSAYITSNAQFSATAPMVVETQINNYSNSTTYKTLLTRASQAGTATDAAASLWRSTAAITSLEVLVNGSTFSTGSTFTLYGIAASSVGAKATGGTIYSDSSYYYHVFAANGTFTPSQSISADVLSIAGGGGTSTASGGGGAGGVVYATSQSLSATGYTVTIGAGGAASTSGGVGNKGNNTTFGALITSNAGGAGTRNGGASANGGSGGGVGSGQTPGTASAGSGGTGYANAGSATPGSSGYGGGGGAGTAGNPNVGGDGLNTWSSWATATGTGVNGYYAGGGGGPVNLPNPGPSQAGGLGGGGASGDRSTGTATAGTAGAVNTGSGAGGGGIGNSVDGSGAAGGSGIVIVRYAK